MHPISVAASYPAATRWTAGPAIPASGSSSPRTCPSRRAATCSLHGRSDGEHLRRPAPPGPGYRSSHQSVREHRDDWRNPDGSQLDLCALPERNRAQGFLLHVEHGPSRPGLVHMPSITNWVRCLRSATNVTLVDPKGIGRPWPSCRGCHPAARWTGRAENPLDRCEPPKRGSLNSRFFRTSQSLFPRQSTHLLQTFLCARPSSSPVTNMAGALLCARSTYRLSLLANSCSDGSPIFPALPCVSVCSHSPVALLLVRASNSESLCA